MRIAYVLGIAALTCLLCVGPALAVTDYSTYSTEELSQLRGTFADKSSEEHAAFQAEWQKRLQSMTPEERQQHMGAGQGRGYGAGQGQGQGYGGGQGKGQGKGLGRGAGPCGQGANQ